MNLHVKYKSGAEQWTTITKLRVTDTHLVTDRGKIKLETVEFAEVQL